MRRIAQWCHDRRRLVIAIWIAALLGVGGLAVASGGGFVDNFSLPGRESQKALDLLEDKCPQQAGDASQGGGKAISGTRADQEHRSEVQALVAELRTLPSVAAV